MFYQWLIFVCSLPAWLSWITYLINELFEGPFGEALQNFAEGLYKDISIQNVTVMKRLQEIVPHKTTTLLRIFPEIKPLTI